MNTHTMNIEDLIDLKPDEIDIIKEQLSAMGLKYDRRKSYKIIDGQVCEIARWTSSCSGCFEFNEGLGLDNYTYDQKAGCHRGAGCHECGYTGKRRHEYWTPVFEGEEM